MMGTVAMSSATGISVEQYLSTSYRPDCDYVDGEVRERNVGEYEHSDLQTGLAVWLRARQREWNIRVLVTSVYEGRLAFTKSGTFVSAPGISLSSQYSRCRP